MLVFIAFFVEFLDLPAPSPRVTAAQIQIKVRIFKREHHIPLALEDANVDSHAHARGELPVILDCFVVALLAMTVK